MRSLASFLSDHRISALNPFMACVLPFAVIFGALGQAAAETYGERYAVIISKSTKEDPQWKEVVEILRDRHDAETFVYENDLSEVKDRLSQFFPKYMCLVAKPEEADKPLVEAIHRLTRSLDDDPYGDCLWGILTGYNAEDAKRIASHQVSLEIRRGLAATCGGWLSYLQDGIGYSEGEKYLWWIKVPSEETIQARRDGPGDTTQRFVEELNSDKVDMMWTSGHASEHDWQIGYSYPNGRFVSSDGHLFGVDLQGVRYEISSSNPKIYYAPGNCLIGHVSDKDCMALAWIHSGGAYQFCGYIVPTWYGFMGWGIARNFFDLKDRFTFSEAFFLTNQQLLYGLEKGFVEGRKRSGHLYDRDVVAFYGDPLWEARIAGDTISLPALYDSELVTTSKDDKVQITFKIKANKEVGFDPLRPVASFLPMQVKKPTDISTDADDVVITDNFVLMQIQGTLKEGEERYLTFTAEPGLITDVEEEQVQVLPQEFVLSQNFPNPFNPSTLIKYHLPEQANVRLVVYDILGRRVKVLVDKMQPAGYYSVTWDGRDDSDKKVGAGTYLYRLEAGDFVQTRKMALIR